MMKTQTYTCRIKILSPVHIGCDEVYEPTGFTLDERRKELIAFEPTSFLGRLEQQDLDKFSAICRKGTVQSLLEIYKFIRRHKEHAHGRRVHVVDGIISHYQKTLKLQPHAVQQRLNKFQIARTAYQPISGVPYIPGSALKGALRTAVLNLRNGGKSQPQFRGKAANMNLQELVLDYNGRQMETDPFRLVKVGDFQAVGDVRQKIVYAVNRKKKPSKKEARGPYQILEVIEAGTKFVGIITIQKPPAGAEIRQPIDMDELRQALRFYNQELQREKISLNTIGCEQALQDLHADSATFIRMGRHSGAESVTVSGRRDIKIMQGPGEKPRYKDHTTTLWLAAASDNPSTNSLLQPFGWAEFDLLTAEEAEKYDNEQTAAFKAWEHKQQAVLTAYSARAEQQARQREEERRIQEQRKAEQRQREKELSKYPWRAVLPRLTQVNDWGALKTQVLENEEFLKHQAEKEVGQAVVDTARRIVGTIGKKWTSDRDDILAAWTAVSGATWKPLAPLPTEPETAPINTELLAQINGLQSWVEFKKSGVKIPKLDKECALALKEKFSSWKLKRSNDKQQKKAYNQLVKRLKKLT